MEKTKNASKASTWRKRLQWLALAGFLVAIAPLLIAGVGLAVESPYLQTYHWLMYFSVPLGLGITFLSGLAATILWLQDRRNSRD